MTDSDQPFEDWDALVAYVRGCWTLEAIDADGAWFERVWQWAERSQQVTIAVFDHGGDPWVSWAGAIADEAQMTDAQLIEATDADVGRIIRDDGCCWLEQNLPLALLTPRLFERYSDAFARRADNLEREITGGDRD